MSALDLPAPDIRTASASRTIRISFGSACLAWMFDAMDLTIFTIVLFPSVSELVNSTDPGLVAYGIAVQMKIHAKWKLDDVEVDS